MYRLEWLQHQFPYHNVRSLDLVQMRSIPQDLLEFSAAFRYEGVLTLPRVTRQWEVANVRYVLAPAGFLKVMHRELDPVQQRFRIVERFDIVARPGIASPLSSEEFTAVSATNGSFAIFEFSGALPRAGFYSHWETVTNRAEALARLPDPAFDPSATVLVEGLAGPSSGATASPVQPIPLVSYTPRNLTYSVTNVSPGVLLLSERFDPRWRVSVDGASSTVLVCNGVFRGVHLPAGSHRVEFVFQPRVYTLWISGAAVLAGLLLLGALWFIPGARTSPESALRPVP
jgi:hypothetical protein